MTSSKGFEPGFLIGGTYKVIRYLGSGGIGQVYEVTSQGKPFAVKVLISNVVPPYISTEKIKKILIDEIPDVPSIIKPITIDEESNSRFLVEEFITGISLNEVISQFAKNNQFMNPADASCVVIRLLESLNNWPPFTVHGNIKPSNVFIPGWNAIDTLPKTVPALLTDSGFSRLLSFSKFASIQLGQGNPYYYMAPEYISHGGKVDPKADLFSIGALYYELLTNKGPRKGFRPASEIVPELPKSIDDLINRALDKNPDKRFHDAEDMIHTVLELFPDIPLLSEVEARQAVQPEEVVTVFEDKIEPGFPSFDESTRPAEVVEETIAFEEAEISPEEQPTEKYEPAQWPPLEPTEEVPFMEPGAVAEVVPEAHFETPAIEEPLPQVPAPEEIKPPSVKPKTKTTPPVRKIEKKAKPPKAAKPKPTVPVVTTAPAKPSRTGLWLGVGLAVIVVVLIAYFAISNRTQPPAPISQTISVVSHTPVPTPPPVELTPTETAQIEPATAPEKGNLQDLLDKAKQAMSTKTYVKPKSMAAFTFISAIKKIDPNHPYIQTAIDKMSVDYIKWTKNFIKTESWNDAEQTVKEGLLVDPENKELKSLLAQIEEGKMKAAAIPAPTPEPPAETAAAESPKPCPDGMVYIPPGTFRLGSDPDDPMKKENEANNTPVFVQAFCIDRYEFPNKAGAMPKTGIAWAEAKVSCESQGKRLCSEKEWEKACKGTTSRRFPYGNEYNDSKCATQTASGANRAVSSSGSFGGCRSPYGVYDMSGNAMEWIASASYVKGGAGNSPDWAGRCATKLPASNSSYIGFRCCRNSQE